MNREIFNGSTVEECINKACNELNISKSDIKYEILEERNGIFKKKAQIAVEVEEEKDEKSVDGTACIINGKLIVTNPKENGDFAKIVIPQNIFVIIDGVQVFGKKEVNNSMNIKFKFDEIEKPTRKLNISITPDNLEAYIDISYVSKNEFKLKDVPESNEIILEPEVSKQQRPPAYTESELRNELNKNKIVYGILEESIKKCASGKDISRMLVAAGVKVQNDQDDSIEFKININGNSKFKENENGNIDFKSIGFVNAVTAGDIIAIKHEGAKGINGKDIYGKEIKKKLGKKLSITCDENCKIENNKVIALKSGKASFKGNKFFIVGVHEVNSDVDLKTGNIKFLGAVNVKGSVLEGMSVESGNDIIINNNVESAVIKAKGNVTIGKNAILSQIYSGGEDVEVLSKIELLDNLSKNIAELIDAVSQIKKYNTKNKFSSDGEIIKVLIESKFKNITKMCKSYILLVSNINDKFEKIFIQKLIGIAPLRIKDANELMAIVEEAKEEIGNLKAILSIPSDINISYCQECTIEGSGNIYINGKGEYISNITSNNSIEFINKDAVARGGQLKAKNEIKCGVVGSIGGVVTRVCVDIKGHIYCEVAYPNTIFAVGNKEFTIDNPSKNIHAYVDHKDDLIVDKLLL
ncbi:flagellar assembly protein A [Clostridium neuense]|uniref:Flagellar assembly protein A n=1 Tax=Clostridium neuense TaxID=1728934 RepID=A0ABW8TJY7_9CLOT